MLFQRLIKRLHRLAIWVGIGLAGPLVSAMTVEATGTAAIDGSLHQAREMALKDAMRQASLRGGVQLQSSQQMRMGELEQDDVSIHSRARLADVQVLWEDEVDGLYQVTISADVQPKAMCPANGIPYRKSIAVAGFGLIHPQQASLGRLNDIERSLAQHLVRRMGRNASLQALDASGISLYEDPERAPAMETRQQRLTTSVSLATQLGAQYVVSGVVRDLSLTGARVPTSRESRPGWRGLLGLEPREEERQFVVSVFVHDGLSGALLHQQEYQTLGAWNLPANRATGFASPEFWRTAYGSAVDQLLSGMVDDLSEVLRCQPFMARIVQTSGNRLHIDASAAAGIRPGDRFQVYRTGTIYNLDLEPATELTDMATEVIVKQVQPQFVIAEMQYSAEHLAIQRDDLVIAW